MGAAGRFPFPFPFPVCVASSSESEVGAAGRFRFPFPFRFPVCVTAPAGVAEMDLVTAVVTAAAEASSGDLVTAAAEATSGDSVTAAAEATSGDRFGQRPNHDSLTVSSSMNADFWDLGQHGFSSDLAGEGGGVGPRPPLEGGAGDGRGRPELYVPSWWGGFLSTTPGCQKEGW